MHYKDKRECVKTQLMRAEQLSPARSGKVKPNNHIAQGVCPGLCDSAPLGRATREF